MAKPKKGKAKEFLGWLTDDREVEQEGREEQGVAPSEHSSEAIAPGTDRDSVHKASEERTTEGAKEQAEDERTPDRP